MAHLLMFDEIFKERIWGGRNLERLFGKSLPGDRLIGESWELVDLPEDKSMVNVGPAAGKNIAQLVVDWKDRLLGRSQLDGGQFPLLVKFLDANDILSVQVHPDREAAEKFGDDVRAKYEAWYIVDAEEDAYIYMGFKAGVDRSQIRQAIEDGTLANLLVKLPARRGDCFYIPGGTVHALGSGLVVAEVQTPSDTTFRLYDWKRVDAKTGMPRELHIEQAMECVRLDVQDSFGQSRCELLPGKTQVCAPTFCLEKAVRKPGEQVSVPGGQAIAWIMIEGSGTMTDGTVELTLEPGKVVLIPAGIEKVVADFTSQSTCLEVKLT